MVRQRAVLQYCSWLPTRNEDFLSCLLRIKSHCRFTAGCGAREEHQDVESCLLRFRAKAQVSGPEIFVTMYFCSTTRLLGICTSTTIPAYTTTCARNGQEGDGPARDWIVPKFVKDDKNVLRRP